MTVENQTSAVVYKNFLNRSDLEYVVTSNSLKENIVVYAPQSEYIYRFDLDSDGLVPTEQANGSIKWTDPKNPDETVFCLMRRICMMQTIMRALMFQCPLKLIATVMC